MLSQLRYFRDLAGRMAQSSDGSISIQFALTVIIIIGLVGGGIDYARATRVRVTVQSGLDSAVLAGAKDGTPDWSTAAERTFNGNIDTAMLAGASPTFTIDSEGTVTGAITAPVATTLTNAIGFKLVNVSAYSVAKAQQDVDNSCLLSLDQGGDTTDDALTFNGAPNLNFSKCTIRSNTSMRCNGHDGGSVQSIAVGSADGCSNPKTRRASVVDIYAPIASNITKLCGTARPGATWGPASPPANAIVVTKATYTEYHVCGDLILTGTGYLTGATPTSDSVIVVENGTITVDDNSNVSTKRVALVLTGNNSYASSLIFPNGKGKAAVLALSPPITRGDPWRGISFYQDPALTNNVDNDWGPGTTLNPDGIVYLPHSNVTISGSAASNIDNCTKLVTNSMRTNGSVDLRFGQSSGCEALGVTQWSDTSVYLSK